MYSGSNPDEASNDFPKIAGPTAPRLDEVDGARQWPRSTGRTAEKWARMSSPRPMKPRQPGFGLSITAFSNQTPPGDIQP